MLVIGRVVRARRQHGHGRRFLPCRRQRVEVFEQQVGIVLDRPDRLRGEELGEEPHHHPAVFQHVGHAGGHAQVVLENVVLAFAGADDVHAGDMCVDAAGDVHALHFLAVLLVAEHALARHDARLKDLLIVIDVVQERIQSADALAQAPVQHLPLVRRDDARHDVERNQPLGPRFLAVDGKGDADAMERALGLLPLLGDPCGRRPAEPAGERLVMGPHPTLGCLHFVVWGAGGHENNIGVARTAGLPIANPGPCKKSLLR